MDTQSLKPLKIQKVFLNQKNKKDKKEVTDKSGESTDKKSDKGITKKTTAPVNPKTEMKTISKLKGANVIRKAEKVENADVGGVANKEQFNISDYKTSSESVIYFLKKYHKHINNDTIIPPPYVKCLDCAFARWGS